MGYRDYGHYIEKPIVSGPGTMLIPRGMSLHDTYVLRDTDSLPFTQIILEEGALADICFFVMPGASADVPITVQLIGPQASINLSAIYLCGGQEKVSIRTEFYHRAPECSSDQLVNGIAGGSSQFQFFGKIIVAPDAQKTEAYQLNRNILLTREAHVDTKPQLEIYADDVVCNHGATIGSLNEDEQFYMRSRGIPEKEAKVLQALSFMAPVLAHVMNDEERDAIQRELEEGIRKIV